MLNDRSIVFGFGLAVVGLLVAMGGLIPGVVPKGQFPWPIIAGSAIYIPGAFLAFFSSKGKSRNQVFAWLRFVRMGFFVLMLFWILKFAQG